MIRLKNLEVYNSIFNINTTTKKFELSTDTFDEFSFEELKDELEEILDISYITSESLRVDILGPRMFSVYKKLETEKRERLMVIICYYWVRLDLFSESLKVIIDWLV